MIEHLLSLTEDRSIFPVGSLVLCAVSGGIDSICLLHLLWTQAPRQGFSVAAAHYNHHLRGEESDRDQEFVRTWCRDRGIPLTIGGGDVAQAASEQGLGIEETARRMRYSFLLETAQRIGAQSVATAHTADDNAETVLLHLIRGAGTQGLCGIPPQRGRIIRPLLNCTRAEIETYCRHYGLTHVEDSSNTDERYTRKYLRPQVMPLLLHMNPQAVKAISGAAGRLREDQMFLDQLAEEQALALSEPGESGFLQIPRAALLQLPAPVRIRTVRKLLERAGCGANCTSQRLESVLRLCENSCPSAQLNLPGLVVRLEYQMLVLMPVQEESEVPPAVPLELNGSAEWGAWRLHCRCIFCPPEPSADKVCLSRQAITGIPVIRARRVGDRLKLPGRPEKTLKKLMIEEKIPAAQREQIPVLADETQVLSVAGLGTAEFCLARPGQAALELHWERIEEHASGY